MISNNLRVLLATPATAPPECKGAHVTHQHTERQAHAQNSHLFSSTNTHTGAFVCTGTVGFGHTEILERQHIHKTTVHQRHNCIDRTLGITTSSILTGFK